MRKLGQPLLDDGPAPRRFKYGGVMTILTGLALMPLAYETGLLGYARWRALTGPVPEVKTPVLDMLGNGYQRVKEDFQEVCRPVTRYSTWSSSYMLPFVIFWTVVGILLLRKC